MASRDRDAETERLRNSVSCTDCFNAMAFCMSPTHQFDVYWREGEFDMCEKKMAELKFCFALKSAEPAKAREMLKTLAQVPPSPTEGTVWSARPRTDPGLAPVAPPRAGER